jgi:hypothetical protein
MNRHLFYQVLPGIREISSRPGPAGSFFGCSRFSLNHRIGTGCDCTIMVLQREILSA